jgi:hypothetical protein
MFTGINKEELSEIKEMDISQQIKTIVAIRFKDLCFFQNLEFRNNKGLSIGNTKIDQDPVD